MNELDQARAAVTKFEELVSSRNDQQLQAMARLPECRQGLKAAQATLRDQIRQIEPLVESLHRIERRLTNALNVTAGKRKV